MITIGGAYRPLSSPPLVVDFLFRIGWVPIYWELRANQGLTLLFGSAIWAVVLKAVVLRVWDPWGPFQPELFCDSILLITTFPKLYTQGRCSKGRGVMVIGKSLHSGAIWVRHFAVSWLFYLKDFSLKRVWRLTVRIKSVFNEACVCVWWNCLPHTGRIKTRYDILTFFTTFWPYHCD